jgi:glucose/arabinose dehydrogenase
MGIRDQEVLANSSVETDCAKLLYPVQELQPHAAALAIKFYRGNMFPSKYKNQAFIAEHGSWNRPTQVTGYRVSLVTLDAKGDALSYPLFYLLIAYSTSYDEFAGGFTVKNVRGNIMGNEMGCGRPVDIVELPDGSLLVSDDHAGRVYRITYREH